jgi:hypothetical protein
VSIAQSLLRESSEVRYLIHGDRRVPSIQAIFLMVMRCWRMAFSSSTGEMALCSREAFFWQCANSIKVNHELLFERIHDKRKERV